MYSPAANGPGSWQRDRSLRLGLLVISGLWLSDASGANWFAEAGLSSRVTYTNNASFASAGQRESDVIVDLTPSFVLRGIGRRLRVSGAMSLTGLTYVNGSEPGGFTPTGSLTANGELLERWLFADAGVTVSQQLRNPLAPQPDGPATFNRLTTTEYRVSPYVERALPYEMRVSIRWDNTWRRVHDLDSAAAESYSARYTFRLEQRPLPLGWALEADRVRTDFAEGTTATPDIDTARIRLRYAIGGRWAIGARAGYERSELFVASDRERTFAGAEIEWQPTERTRFAGFWEDRSFGSGWQVNFTHRMPQLAWNLGASRDFASSAQPSLSLPGGNIAALLDAAFTTRITDPVDRARAVEDFLVRQGLPRETSGPTTIFTDRLVLRTVRNLGLTWIGRRSTLALNGSYQRDQTPVGDLFVVLPAAAPANVVQWGGGLTFAHRVAPLTSLSASAGWRRTRDDAGAAADTSRQWSFRAQLDHQLGARTTAFAGTRYQVFRSTVIDDSDETGVFAGIGHRF